MGARLPGYTSNLSVGGMHLVASLATVGMWLVVRRNCDPFHLVGSNGLQEQQIMDALDFKALQAPLKAEYRDNPSAAQLTLRASGRLGDESITCRVETGRAVAEAGRAVAEAGLHPATGGDGQALCSGDMLLESLVACAGVTLRAVATALEIPVRGGEVTAEGDLDFRGTLAVDREAPVGLTGIRLGFALDTDADAEQLATLARLTERYCVVLQTLVASPEVSVECRGNRS